MIDLEQILKTNISINPSQSVELEKVVTNYPWFSLAHQLILIAYKQNNNPHFAEKCRETAVYTLNRRRFYMFVEKATQQKQVKQNDHVTAVNTANAANAHDDEKDNLLLNFSHEYFSIEDLPPINAVEKEESDDKLIAKFISENPRIIPKPFPISDLDSLIQIDDEVEEEPVSEMLAQIYVEQGLYDLAISSYEKLSLLNPKKSIYFASLIDDLRSKQK